jgi:hypothetical protein
MKEGRDMAKTDKPNILIIWGDDIGWFNISANNNGIMGYRTPNIDRVAKSKVGLPGGTTRWFSMRRRQARERNGDVRLAPAVAFHRIIASRCYRPILISGRPRVGAKLHPT